MDVLWGRAAVGTWASTHGVAWRRPIPFGVPWCLLTGLYPTSIWLLECARMSKSPGQPAAFAPRRPRPSCAACAQSALVDERSPPSMQPQMCRKMHTASLNNTCALHTGSGVRRLLQVAVPQMAWVVSVDWSGTVEQIVPRPCWWRQHQMLAFTRNACAAKRRRDSSGDEGSPRVGVVDPTDSPAVAAPASRRRSNEGLPDLLRPAAQRSTRSCA